MGKWAMGRGVAVLRLLHLIGCHTSGKEAVEWAQSLEKLVQGRGTRSRRTEAGGIHQAMCFHKPCARCDYMEKAAGPSGRLHQHHLSTLIREKQADDDRKEKRSPGRIMLEQNWHRPNRSFVASITMKPLRVCSW